MRTIKLQNFKIGTGKYPLGLLLLFIIWAMGCGDMKFGFGMADPEDPILAPSPDKTTAEYGKFVIYKLGDGKIYNLAKDNEKADKLQIYYRVTDLPYETFFGSPDDIPDEHKYAWLWNWNVNKCGDGYDESDPIMPDPDQTIYYKNYKTTFGFCNNRLAIRPGSDHPEAVVLRNRLFLYYTNFPVLDSYYRVVCDCYDTGTCPKVMESGDFVSDPSQPEIAYSTLGGLNCLTVNNLYSTTGNPDKDWMRIPIPDLIDNSRLPGVESGDTQTRIPLKIKVIGDRVVNMRSNSRIIQLSLYETESGELPGATPVISARYGIDFSKNWDPELGYVCDPSKDYWLEIYDLTSAGDSREIPSQGLINEPYPFQILFEATPVVEIPFDSTAKIAKAGTITKTGAVNDKDAYFEPDDTSTLVEDKLPDCDGIAGSGDEGDWGIYEICPIQSGKIDDPYYLGIKDGLMQYWEVDNIDNIDDGEFFSANAEGAGWTNLSSMGDEAPSIIQVGDTLWMFAAVGSGIFQLNSEDGLIGLQWNMDNIKNNQPSLVPRASAGDTGDPNAPVVSSGRFGYCDTLPEADDTLAFTNLTAETKGKVGYPDTVCITFGKDGNLDSYPMRDEQAGGAINTGADGVINTFYFPNCLHYYGPFFEGNNEPDIRIPYLINLLNTEAPGNGDLLCDGSTDILGNTVPVGSDESAYLLGDDEWLTNEIGLNPSEYWRSQRCNPLMMAKWFDRCALGGKSNEVSATPGTDNKLNTVQDFLYGDDELCHNGDMVGICAGKNGKFDQPGVQNLVNSIFYADTVTQGDDQLGIITVGGETVGGGLEYVRFKWEDTVQLKHKPIKNGTVKVVSMYLAYYRKLGIYVGSPELMEDTDYEIDYTNGTITMLGGNWLAPLAVGADNAFFGDMETRRKDVLIVLYQYEGEQIGIISGRPDGGIDTPNDYFYIFYRVPDRYIGGPFLEFSPGMKQNLIGKSQNLTFLELPKLGDTHIGNIEWDANSLSFRCLDNTCPISPGSDNSLDTAWALDGKVDNWQWLFQFNGGIIAEYIIKVIQPNRYDIYGHYDDWLCSINGELALCPGGDGYFQLYSLWSKTKVKEYKGIDDVLENYQSSNNPCYSLEASKQPEGGFYDPNKTVFTLYAYQGMMGDDRIKWDGAQYVLTTGTNGINQSCVRNNDIELIPKNKGSAYQSIISSGDNAELDSYPMQDNRTIIDAGNERPIEKITSGADGICNTYSLGDDRAEVFFGTGAPDYPCVRAGADGIANTTAAGNDSQLYLPREKTGFDAYQIATPEAVKTGNQLYLYYAGLGWMDAPKAVPPDRGSLAAGGDCKRPGLDNRWGDTNYQFSSEIENNEAIKYVEPALVTKGEKYSKGGLNYAVYTALDDNQGVLLAPRIGVATSTVSRVKADPTDWSRVSSPALDAGTICHPPFGTMGFIGDLLETMGFAIEGVYMPSSFNYYGAFSPEVLIRYNEGDNKPVFLMFVSGIYDQVSQDWLLVNNPGRTAHQTSLPAGLNKGILEARNQIGLARSADGLNFQTANSINPLLISPTGDMMKDLNNALGQNIFSNEPKFSALHPTVFLGKGNSYGMIYKHMLQEWGSKDGFNVPGIQNINSGEWLGLAVRKGLMYGGGIGEMISCRLNAQRAQAQEDIYKWSASLILILPLLGLISFRIWTKLRKKRV